MQDLLRTQCDAGRNAPRDFWRWIDRQPWRRMLPFPMEHPGLLNSYRIDIYYIYMIYSDPDWHVLSCIYSHLPLTPAGSARC